MFDRVLNIFLKTFRSFVERRIKTVNPLSTFAVEGVINRESMKFFYWQKHPTEVFYKKAVLVLKFRNIHWKAPVVESLSKSSRSAKLLKTPIFKNIFQRLLLYRHFFLGTHTSQLVWNSLLICEPWFSTMLMLYSVFLSSSFLTHFNPVSHFYTPWKCQKTKGLQSVFLLDLWILP